MAYSLDLPHKFLEAYVLDLKREYRRWIEIAEHGKASSSRFRWYSDVGYKLKWDEGRKTAVITFESEEIATHFKLKFNP